MRARTFQARANVWATFEAIARERGVSMDELIQEAMTAYARSRGHLVAEPRQHDPLEETRDSAAFAAELRGGGRGDAYDDDLARTAARATKRGGFEGPHGRGGLPPQQRPAPAPPPSLRAPPTFPSRGGGPSPGRQPSSARSLPPPLPPASMRPPATQRMPGAPHGAPQGRPMAPPAARPLVLVYEGRSYPVDKDRFLIGRSKNQSDLRLDDPNVSRQHVAIERAGVAWYVVDLGSTNGVYVAGDRVARRAIADGDVLVISNHEIRCVFS